MPGVGAVLAGGCSPESSAGAGDQPCDGGISASQAAMAVDEQAPPAARRSQRPPMPATVPSQSRYERCGPRGCKKPNIVFVLADDLDLVTTERFFDKVELSHLPELQAAEIEPVLDETMKLRAEGITFPNAFAPTSVCCPARATILSGKMGHNTNVLNNGGDLGGWAAFRDEDGTAVPAGQSAQRNIQPMLLAASLRLCALGLSFSGPHNPDCCNAPRRQ
jgi:hypothetical protein